MHPIYGIYYLGYFYPERTYSPFKKLDSEPSFVTQDLKYLVVRSFHIFQKLPKNSNAQIFFSTPIYHETSPLWHHIPWLWCQNGHYFMHHCVITIGHCEVGKTLLCTPPWHRDLWLLRKNEHYGSHHFDIIVHRLTLEWGKYSRLWGHNETKMCTMTRS